MIVDSEIDSYSDDVVPIETLASFSISSSRDNTGPMADKAHAATENGEIVHLYAFWRYKGANDGVFLCDFYRALPARSISCQARHRTPAFTNH
jgi:hypothetical protein